MFEYHISNIIKKRSENLVCFTGTPFYGKGLDLIIRKIKVDLINVNLSFLVDTFDSRVFNKNVDLIFRPKHGYDFRANNDDPISDLFKNIKVASNDFNVFKEFLINFSKDESIINPIIKAYFDDYSKSVNQLEVTIAYAMSKVFPNLP